MSLDLNADLGEGMPDVDAALMPLVTSANIACGLHAGDAHTMARTVALALRHGVAIGAHPGYDDRLGFGRRPQQLSPPEVVELVLYQLGALDAIAQSLGASVNHVKPHGALYNHAEKDRATAVAIITAMRSYDPRLRLVGRAQSAMQQAASALGQAFTPEAFADRRYLADGSLAPRSDPESVISDADAVDAQVRSLATEGEVVSIDGHRLKVAFRSLCVHGDTAGAPLLAGRVRQTLETLGISLSAPRLLGIDTLPP